MNWITTQMPDSHWLTEARLKGTKVIAVTVEYSATASKCDEVVVIRPGSDPALALGIAQVILAEGRYDRDFVQRFTDLPSLVRMDTLERLRARDVFPNYEDRLPANGTQVVRKGEKAPPTIRQSGKHIPEGLLDEFADFVMWDTRAAKPVAVSHDTLGEHFTQLGIEPALEGKFTVELVDGRKVEVCPVLSLIREYLDQNMTPKQVSQLTWAPAEAVVSLARQIAAHAGATIGACGMGPNQFWNNDNKDRALFLVLALTANLGRHGANIGSYAGTYKNTLFSGVASRYVQEDPFNPQLDPDGEAKARAYTRSESMHYWANGERILKVGNKTITAGPHCPTPTKAIWQVNSNSSLGNQKGHFDVVFNTLPRVELVAYND